ncbi:hypothetical protein RT97_26025 [Variovorax paradoxus]|uniref:Uncharacterized protein n=2 Tax=Variovorax paradoxus TaxID=34073 RepID=A0A0D0LSU1_VARPD|nr:hypothetical protein RT97_26025 [Variovorax paradoxus]
MRRGVDVMDIDRLLIRNSEARQAHWRATEESRRAAGFLVGMCVVAVYSCAFVVSMICLCDDPVECGCSRSAGALIEHAIGWAPPACACLK